MTTLKHNDPLPPADAIAREARRIAETANPKTCKVCLEVPADQFDTLEELGGTCQKCTDEFNRGAA